MKNSWAQPSLSRDFAVLSAAVLFLLFLISGWVTYTTYAKYAENIAAELEKEGTRTERALSEQMGDANYLLEALGKQIVIEPERNLTRLAQMLKAFDNKGNVYTLFAWVNPDQKLVVSSSKGVLEQPIDISDRDYVKKAFADPWKMAIGNPIEGRASGRWIIPVAMGFTDYTGKFIGTLLISIDVDIITAQIGDLIKRDGINFAIVSKTLAPLMQMSDDKDFINHTFPADRLINTDFSANPSGLVKQGSPFWDGGSYGYYRVSQDYPYVVLMGYDMRYGNEAMHSQLWSRLLQVLVMAIFFVLLLWIIRARMIKPVLDMTAIAAGVARGEICASLPGGGPIEMAGLAAQIRRISEYIEENKRVEDELRNKMFMFKKAKEQAEIDQRSKSEFLAYICQEMRTPINNIIGAAQVMKDQLYGPIENRKYRQYAADIYSTANALLNAAQDVLVQSKAETDYLKLEEKPVDVQAVINRALRFMADKMQIEKLNVKVNLQEPVPRLIADDFRLQQIIMNILLYALGHLPPEGTAILETRVVNENKDKMFFALTISTAKGKLPTSAELIVLADRIMGAPYRPSRVDDLLKERTDLNLELAKVLVALHGGVLEISQPAKGEITITVLLSGNRIRFVEGT